MKRYMMDTNAISHLLRGYPGVTRRVLDVPMASLCISAITEGELLFGLSRRPDAKRLHSAVRELLLRIEVLPWTHDAAECYCPARAELERHGKSLGSLDLLIAAHALAVGAVLVTNDKAFGQIAKLPIEDWTG